MPWYVWLILVIAVAIAVLVLVGKISDKLEFRKRARARALKELYERDLPPLVRLDRSSSVRLDGSCIAHIEPTAQQKAHDMAVSYAATYLGEAAPSAEDFLCCYWSAYHTFLDSM